MNVAATVLSVLKVNGFVVVELVASPARAREQFSAVNGLTTILLSRYEICQARIVTMPFKGLLMS